MGVNIMCYKLISHNVLYLHSNVTAKFGWGAIF